MQLPDSLLTPLRLTYFFLSKSLVMLYHAASFESQGAFKSDPSVLMPEGSANAPPGNPRMQAVQE